MSPELDKQLCDKYPKIFVNRNKSLQESCMHWGLEVGDGWYDLIDVLCEALTYTFTTSVQINKEDAEPLGIKPHIDRDGKAFYYFSVKPPQVIADQVKEKFGTLRFYYHLVYDDINIKLIDTGKYPNLESINRRYADYFDGIVHFADIASGHTCSVSGTKGEVHVRGGWLKVISKEIAKESKYQEFKPFNQPPLTTISPNHNI